MARLPILLSLYICGSLAMQGNSPLPTHLESQDDKQTSECGVFTDKIADIADLVRWVKLGKPPLKCTYSEENSSQIFPSLERLKGYIRSSIIPVDDGFDYSWLPTSDGIDLLSRNPRQNGKDAVPETVRKVSMPESGIQTLVEIDDDFGRTPVHGIDGFYGYDHFDGEYSSPTNTNAEEDLIFNVTMAATVFDIMNMLFPDKVEAMCIIDGHIGGSDCQSCPEQSKYSRQRFQKTGSTLGRFPARGSKRQRKGKQTYENLEQGADGRPIRAKRDLPERLPEEEFSVHEKLGRRLLMDFRFLANKQRPMNPAASKGPIYRPYGDKKYNKDYQYPGEVLTTADFLL